MRAEELRIGNYVNNAFGDLIVINSINNITSSGYNLQSLFPIQITEGILIMFGFDYKKTEKANVYRLGLFMINFVTEGRYKGKKFIRFGNLNLDVNNCLYIHQLQNLYFALTGEEL